MTIYGVGMEIFRNSTTGPGQTSNVVYLFVLKQGLIAGLQEICRLQFSETAAVHYFAELLRSCPKCFPCP